MKLTTDQLIAKIANQEKEVKNYKEVLHQIKTAAQMGIWEVDLEKHTMKWSDVTKQIHGVEVDYEPTIEEGIHFYPEGKNRQVITEVFKEAIEKGINYDLELQILTATGNLKWVRLIGISEIKNGKCEKLYGLIQDIDQAVKYRLELEQQKKLFRQTFEFAPNGMALVGLDGNWTQVNQQVCIMLGYTKEELSKLTFQDITHPDDLDLDLKLLEELLAGKRESYQMEKRYFHKSGNLVWALLSVSLMKDKEGNPVHFVSQLTDITDKKLLLETTLEQNDRLLNFAHIVSHNLRSHTSNFSMLLSMMKMENPKLVENEFFPFLLQSSSSLQETLSYLTDIVVMQNEVKDNTKALNLYKYVEKAHFAIQSLVSSSNAEIHNEVDKDIFVDAIPAYLESIILNFFTNSIKYCSNKRNPIIFITSEIDPSYVVFSIKDNGLGIDLEKHGKKLFGMYKTFHEKEDSRGIGLFITKNQIEALGGKVEVESQVNQGTTFKIYLKHGKI
ncbi:PAS domain S-box protein [Bernardetia sp. MNP-M8]|uniref:sensor histidine kinase n=1 Tax=Bernardetia sp. MNP-M8 TaxID=3127470 RepID=UPI0030CB8FA2